MKVGVLTKDLPMQLECIDKEKGVFNLYIPGSLNLNAIKSVFLNPPEDAQYITVYDAEGKDRWRICSSFGERTCHENVHEKAPFALRLQHEFCLVTVGTIFSANFSFTTS